MTNTTRRSTTQDEDKNEKNCFVGDVGTATSAPLGHRTRGLLESEHRIREPLVLLLSPLLQPVCLDHVHPCEDGLDHIGEVALQTHRREAHLNGHNRVVTARSSLVRIKTVSPAE